MITRHALTVSTSFRPTLLTSGESAAALKCISNHMPAVTPVASYSLALDYHQFLRREAHHFRPLRCLRHQVHFHRCHPRVAVFTITLAFILIPSSFAFRVVEHLPQPITLRTTFITHVREFIFDGNAFLGICHLTLVLLFDCI